MKIHHEVQNVECGRVTPIFKIDSVNPFSVTVFLLIISLNFIS